MVVERFLKDIADGRYDGYPHKGLVNADNALENSGMRAFYGITTLKRVQVVNILQYSLLLIISKSEMYC